GVGECPQKESAGNRFGQQSQPPTAFVGWKEIQLRRSTRFFPELPPAARRYPSASEMCLKLQTLAASKFQPPRQREPPQRHLSQKEPQQIFSFLHHSGLTRSRGTTD